MQHLGVIGLGTMGANLARNAARNGAKVAVYNRTKEKTDAFLKEHGSEGAFTGCASLKDLVKTLPKPRAILLMVQAGDAVDAVIDELVQHLDAGDILIDGGNSHYRDTERRTEALGKESIRFIGMGVSGGEEGALHGPSMMPGGDRKAVEVLLPLLSSMAASDGTGGRCVAFMGTGGAGHFVKTVHNGIEYAVMQLIAETCDVLASIGGFTAEQLAETFEAWNTLPELRSFLVETTAKAFRARDTDGSALIEKIRDRAGQKGTGKWTVEAAFDAGASAPSIAAAVDARIVSGDETLRKAGREFPAVIDIHDVPPRPQKLRSLAAAALELSVLGAYREGFDILAKASTEHGWKIDRTEVARIWRGGCIIRSDHLELFQGLSGSRPRAYQDRLRERYNGERQLDWRRIVTIAVSRGVPVPALSAALARYDAARRERLPTNVIAAQRDLFGRHGFERVDRPGTFHIDA